MRCLRPTSAHSGEPSLTPKTTQRSPISHQHIDNKAYQVFFSPGQLNLCSLIKPIRTFPFFATLKTRCLIRKTPIKLVPNFVPTCCRRAQKKRLKIKQREMSSSKSQGGPIMNAMFQAPPHSHHHHHQPPRTPSISALVKHPKPAIACLTRNYFSNISLRANPSYFQNFFFLFS